MARPQPRKCISLALLFLAEGVKAKVYFRAGAHHVKGRTLLQVDDMKMDFSVRDIKMGIENLHNGNTVLRKCSSNVATLGLMSQNTMIIYTHFFESVIIKTPVSKHHTMKVLLYVDVQPNAF